MQRRSLLKLGLGSAAVLAAAGGAMALLQPGLRDARLTPAGREIFVAVGRAVLDGSLPEETAARQQALTGLLDGVDALVGALPPHAQGELSQLLALLASGAGRHALAGLRTHWPQAGTAEVQQALQSMRVSALSLRRQAYQALHDIASGAYFAEAATWARLGYPGPMKI